MLEVPGDVMLEVPGESKTGNTFGVVWIRKYNIQN